MEPTKCDLTRNNLTGLQEPNVRPTDKSSALNQRCPSIDELVNTDDGLPLQEKENPAGYDSPPNGGLIAWLQVAGSFFLFFNSWYVIFLKYFGDIALKSECDFYSIDRQLLPHP
jgi:hypothetical protein